MGEGLTASAELDVELLEPRRRKIADEPSGHDDWSQRRKRLASQLLEHPEVVRFRGQLEIQTTQLSQIVDPATQLRPQTSALPELCVEVPHTQVRYVALDTCARNQRPQRRKRSTGELLEHAEILQPDLDIEHQARELLQVVDSAAQLHPQAVAGLQQHAHLVQAERVLRVAQPRAGDERAKEMCKISSFLRQPCG